MSSRFGKGRRLRKLRVSRIDAVDTPANEAAKILITKRDDGRVNFTLNVPFQKATMSSQDYILHDYLTKIKHALPRGHRAHRYLGKAIELLGDPRYGMRQAGSSDMSSRDTSSFGDDRHASQRGDGQPRSADLPNPPDDFDESSDSSSSVSKLFRARAWRVVKQRGDAFLREHPELTRHQAIDRVMKNDSIAREAIGVYQDAPPESDVFPQAEQEAAIGESVAKRQAWSAIERAAARLISKSAAPMSKAKAVCEVMKHRPDLVRAYQGAR